MYKTLFLLDQTFSFISLKKMTHINSDKRDTRVIIRSSAKAKVNSRWWRSMSAVADNNTQKYTRFTLFDVCCRSFYYNILLLLTLFRVCFMATHTSTVYKKAVSERQAFMLMELIDVPVTWIGLFSLFSWVHLVLLLSRCVSSCCLCLCVHVDIYGVWFAI